MPVSNALPGHMADEPTPPPAPDTPQVLLFGHSGSGKSALLGALLRAGQIQGPVLHGEVLDLSGRLVSIRDAVYNGADLKPTDSPLASYTVRLRPWREGTQPVTEPITVVINDCSGTAAEAIIAQPATLRDTSASPLARAVVEADAIMLLVDATSDDEELREAFEEFDAFLTAVAQTKASAREVGGFPILLVLTKCDELARPGDTRAKWEARVRDRAEQAWAKFDAFLKDAEADDDVPSPFLPFGSIDLSVYAVAVRLPKLPETRGEPDTPYGVAELFRDCFGVAKSHRARAAASNRRLKWTVRVALGLVLVMFIGALAITFFPPDRADPGLADRVTGYLRHEAEPAVRLAEPDIIRNKRTLSAFRMDPGFPALPEDLQALVLDRLQEIEDYEAYRNRLLTALAPVDTRTLEDLEQVERVLHGELRLPAAAWAETPAGRLRAKWLADARAIRQAEERFLERYREFLRRGRELMLVPSFGGMWRADTNALIGEGTDPPPAALAEPLPGSPTLNLPRGQAVSARVPFEFERVYLARRDWAEMRQKLHHLRDLADALGLTAGPDRPPAVLAIPDPGPGIDSVTLPGARWTALLRSFNRESEDYREWQLDNFWNPGRGVLEDRLRHSFQSGAQHVQVLIRGELGPNPEQKDNPEGWKALADALGDPASPFPEWGRLLHLLARLRNPTAANPVSELYAFLRQPRFELDLQGFDLRTPGLEGAVPSGPLSVSQTRGGTEVATRRFKYSGAGPATGFSFTPDGERKLTYLPGDALRVEVPMRADNEQFKLVWESGNTRTFQFDRLEGEPRKVRPDGGSEPATNVRLSSKPGSNLPRLPVLFPELKR